MCLSWRQMLFEPPENAFHSPAHPDNRLNPRPGFISGRRSGNETSNPVDVALLEPHPRQCVPWHRGDLATDPEQAVSVLLTGLQMRALCPLVPRIDEKEALCRLKAGDGQLRHLDQESPEQLDRRIDDDERSGSLSPRRVIPHRIDAAVQLVLL